MRRALVCLVFLLTAALLPAVEPASAGALQELHEWLARPSAERPPLTNTAFARMALSRADAAAALAVLWSDRLALLRATRSAEMSAKVIELDGLKLPFDWLSFGNTNAIPPNGRSLFISLHGGGGAPREVNDAQWTNQLRLGNSYAPAEGIYVAPRAPTDAWNMWHQAHVDDFLARLSEDFVALAGVDPNRIFLLGYSAGGDGVYQLAPRTPDLWAAAAMMAGHPNEASPLGLRNVPFAIQVGANDAAYRRNEIAAEWGRQLDALQQADPSGYVHFTELHAGKGHWMDRDDRKAVPWMEKFTRDPLPVKVVWYQDDVTHTRCYWLARPSNEVQAGQTLVAERAGQVIALTSTNVNTVTVLLNDALLDLDAPVIIRSGGQTLFSGSVSRTVARLAETLAERGDPNLAFSAAVTVTLPSSPAPAPPEVPAARREGLKFLMENMPAADRTNLSAQFLLENVALAYEARDTAPWGGQLPPEIFLNDILPYAVVNETRDAWRKPLRELCVPLVRDCRTPGEAAQALNRQVFNLVKVHYSTARAKADQSPLESMQSGKASCTGLSILLVDACRAVGIPARIAGTPMWTNLRGNHTWVEIWDDGWHFLGADEPDAAGLDHGWFVHDAAQAQSAQPEHAIYASSFRPTGLAFPLVWAPEINWVNAVNVTERYTPKAAPPAGTVRLLIQVLDAAGRRVAVPVTVGDPAGAGPKLQGRSRDETADLNDFLPFDWPAGARCEILVAAAGHTRSETITTQTNSEQVVVIRLADKL